MSLWYFEFLRSFSQETAGLTGTTTEVPMRVVFFSIFRSFPLLTVVSALALAATIVLSAVAFSPTFVYLTAPNSLAIVAVVVATLVLIALVSSSINHQSGFGAGRRPAAWHDSVVRFLRLLTSGRRRGRALAF